MGGQKKCVSSLVSTKTEMPSAFPPSGWPAASSSGELSMVMPTWLTGHPQTDTPPHTASRRGGPARYASRGHHR